MVQFISRLFGAVEQWFSAEAEAFVQAVQAHVVLLAVVGLALLAVAIVGALYGRRRV